MEVAGGVGSTGGQEGEVAKKQEKHLGDEDRSSQEKKVSVCSEQLRILGVSPHLRWLGVCVLHNVSSCPILVDNHATRAGRLCASALALLHKNGTKKEKRAHSRLERHLLHSHRGLLRALQQKRKALGGTRRRGAWEMAKKKTAKGENTKNRRRSASAVRARGS